MATVDTPRSDTKKLTAILTDQLGWLSTRSLQILIVLALLAVGVVAVITLRLVVIPVIIALILTAAISPAVAWLDKLGVPRMLSTWITLLFGAGVFAGIVWLISNTVSNQWDYLSESATNGVDEVRGFLDDLPFAISEEQYAEFGETIRSIVFSSQFGSGAIAGVSAVASLITGLILTLVVLFFFLKDGDKIWAFLLKPFDGERYERGVRVGKTTRRVLGGYVRGTAIIAFVDALGIGIVLFVLDIPLALPLSVIVFFSAFIPIVGATLAGTLAALVALVDQGLFVALIVVAAIVLVNQLEGNFLQPVVMAQSLKLHPLVILVALTAGTVLAGIIGAILSVPIVAAVWAIIKIWNVDDDGNSRDNGSGPRSSRSTARSKRSASSDSRDAIADDETRGSGSKNTRAIAEAQDSVRKRQSKLAKLIRGGR